MIRRLSFFLIGVLTLLAFSLYGITHIDELKRNRLTAYAATDLPIYSDQLMSSFVDWSWGGSRDFKATEQKLSGSASIRFTPTAWSALYLHTDNQINAQDYESLIFSIRATAPGQKFKIFFYDQNNQALSTARPLSDFGGDPDASNWQTYTIPVSSLNPSLVPVKGIALQEASGQDQPTVYLDDISMKSKAIPTPTPTAVPTPTSTPTPIPATPTPTSTPTSQPTSSTTNTYVYNDTLSSTWENWSWGSSVRFDNTTPVFTGSRSIDYRTTNAWGAFYLHAKSPFSTTSYSHFTFSMRATTSNQIYSVVLRDSNNNLLSSPIVLSTIGGNPPVGAWKTYSIPLSQLNPANKQVSGLLIQDTSGMTQPTVYIDDLSFTSNSTSTTTPITTSGNPLNGQSFYVRPDSAAKKTVDDYRAAGRYADADHMQKIAAQSTGLWVVQDNPYAVVNDYVSKAASQNTVPVLVAYNIPGRDCGQYSAGGSTYEGYKSWINTFKNAIGDKKAVVILEPDALGLDCLQHDNTYSLLSYAVQMLESQPQTSVYINVSTWVGADAMASRLQKSGIQQAQGFAVNTSGFDTTDAMTKYGAALSGKVGGKHFMIDTSRNGNGPYDPSQPEPWCNPPERALGNRPTTSTGHALVDAYYWIKVPGESDGTCRGGPSAGSWWADYALGLAKRASY